MSGEQKDLTPLKGVRAEIDEVSRKNPGVVAGLNDRDADFHDLYAIEIATGERTLVQKNDQEFAGYYLDFDLKPNSRRRPTPTARRSCAASTASG